MFCARISQFFILIPVRFAESQTKSAEISAKIGDNKLKMPFCANPIL
jgi:hypothetical protein